MFYGLGSPAIPNIANNSPLYVQQAREEHYHVLPHTNQTMLWTSAAQSMAPLSLSTSLGTPAVDPSVSLQSTSIGSLASDSSHNSAASSPYDLHAPEALSLYYKHHQASEEHVSRGRRHRRDNMPSNPPAHWPKEAVHSAFFSPDVTTPLPPNVSPILAGSEQSSANGATYPLEHGAMTMFERQQHRTHPSTRERKGALAPSPLSEAMMYQHTFPFKQVFPGDQPLEDQFDVDEDMDVSDNNEEVNPSSPPIANNRLLNNRLVFQKLPRQSGTLSVALSTPESCAAAPPTTPIPAVEPLSAVNPRKRHATQELRPADLIECRMACERDVCEVDALWTRYNPSLQEETEERLEVFSALLAVSVTDRTPSYIAKYDNQVIACILAYPEKFCDANTLRLGQLYIDQAQKGYRKTIAKRLFAHLISEAKRLHFADITVQVCRNKPAIPCTVYEKMGFTRQDNLSTYSHFVYLRVV